jgi:hypothetical protein
MLIVRHLSRDTVDTRGVRGNRSARFLKPRVLVYDAVDLAQIIKTKKDKGQFHYLIDSNSQAGRFYVDY